VTGSTESHSLENSQRKSLYTWRRTDYVVVVVVVVVAAAALVMMMTMTTTTTTTMSSQISGQCSRDHLEQETCNVL